MSVKKNLKMKSDWSTIPLWVQLKSCKRATLSLLLCGSLPFPLRRLGDNCVNAKHQHIMTECLGFEMPLGYHPYDSYRLIASFVQLETTVYDTCISLFTFYLSLLSALLQSVGFWGFIWLPYLDKLKCSCLRKRKCFHATLVSFPALSIEFPLMNPLFSLSHALPLMPPSTESAAMYLWMWCDNVYVLFCIK